MRFHGVFIGVDRYESQEINWLSSAVRDATALHALFTDNFAGNTVLLADETATNKGIRDELARLAQVSADDDVVVVAFSGHGSSTHALVPYDADRAQPDQTFLSLVELARLLNQVPASTRRCTRTPCERVVSNPKRNSWSRSQVKAASSSRLRLRTSRPMKTTTWATAC